MQGMQDRPVRNNATSPPYSYGARRMLGKMFKINKNKKDKEGVKGK